MRNKHIFIGNTNILAYWITEVPDLINDIAVFFEEEKFAHFLQNIALPSLKKSDRLIIIASNYPPNAYNQFKHWFKFVHIQDYVCHQILNSKLMPRKLRVEASTLCQLDCSNCYMRINPNNTMKQGFLSFNNFKNLIDENCFIDEIELSNSGEIFLNPDLIKIMKYAYEKGIRLTALNGVNFNNVTETQLEALVKYKFHSLMVSIDGASQEVYEIYRRKGNYSSVINNIKKLIQIKKHYNSDMPQIIWQYILMDHTESDVILAKETAKKLNLPIWFKLTWDDKYIPKNKVLLKKETGLEFLTRDEYQQKTSKIYLGSVVCSQLFLSPQINWDGRLLGCCKIYMQDYGVNVFDIGLKNALAADNFIHAKRYLLSDNFPLKYAKSIPCIKCENRIKMQKVNEKINLFDFMQAPPHP